jgi:hypothetical protein
MLNSSAQEIGDRKIYRSTTLVNKSKLAKAIAEPANTTSKYVITILRRSNKAVISRLVMHARFDDCFVFTTDLPD